MIAAQLGACGFPVLARRPSVAYGLRSGAAGAVAVGVAYDLRCTGALPAFQNIPPGAITINGDLITINGDPVTIGA